MLFLLLIINYHSDKIHFILLSSFERSWRNSEPNECTVLKNLSQFSATGGIEIYENVFNNPPPTDFKWRTEIQWCRTSKVFIHFEQREPSLKSYLFYDSSRSSLNGLTSESIAQKISSIKKDQWCPLEGFESFPKTKSWKTVQFSLCFWQGAPSVSS